MRNLWMGIVPGPTATRVLVLDGPGRTLLKARLPQEPRHLRAIPALGEALALWCSRPVLAALAVDEPGASFGMSPWLDSVETFPPSPLCEIQLVPRGRPPRERDRLDGMGEFRDVRQLLLFEVAR